MPNVATAQLITAMITMPIISRLVLLLIYEAHKLPTDSNGHATGGDSRQDLSTNDTIDQTISNHLDKVQKNDDFARPPAHRIPSKSLVTN